MAQTGYTPILVYGSGTTTNVPSASNLTNSSLGSELALNYADGKLFYKDASNVVQVLASTATTAGTFTTITLSGGTANGVAYLNGSKVVTTGSALVFDGTNLGVGVTPSAWSTNYKVLEFPNGCGINGYSGGAVPAFTINNNNYYNGTNNIYKVSSYPATSFQLDQFGQFKWYTAPSGTAGNAITFTTAMTLDASGNLLVGTTTAGGRLTVQGNVATSATITNISQLNGGIRSNGNSSVYETDSGLTFQAGGAGGGAAITLRRGGSYETSLDFYVNSTGGTGACTRAMTLDGSGVLLLGTTTQLATSKITAYSANIIFGASSPASFTGIGYLSSSATAASTSWYHFIGQSSGSTVNNILIYGNGDIQNANNSYGAISDVKLKENIIDATPKLADLMQVKVRNYNLKTDPDQKQIGVIAQELEQVFPSMVEETLDRDADGNTLDTTTKSVKYSVFVPVLIKAIQEQQALIESLTTRLAALEAK